MALRDEIALVVARISDLLPHIETNAASWVQITSLIDDRRRLTESEHRRLVESRQMVSAEETEH